MRGSFLGPSIRMAMLAGVILTVSACGSQGDTSNGSSGGNTGTKDNSGADSAANSVDYGDNDMDSNIAQIDAANSTTVSGGTKNNGSM